MTLLAEPSPNDLLSFPSCTCLHHPAAMFFTVYEGIKNQLEPHTTATPTYAPLVHMLAASIGETVRARARALLIILDSSRPLPDARSPRYNRTSLSPPKQCACLVRVPTENVKQNVQAGRYSTNWEAIASIHKAEGLPGFYKGFLSTVFREVRRRRRRRQPLLALWLGLGDGGKVLRWGVDGG